MKSFDDFVAAILGTLAVAAIVTLIVGVANEAKGQDE